MSNVTQEAGGSKERLARISHHFLSGQAQPSAKGGKGTLVIPVVAVDGAHTFPFSRLTQALLARGRAAHVLEPERGLQDVPPTLSSPTSRQDQSAPATGFGGGGGPADLERTLLRARDLSPRPDLVLLPLAESDTPLISRLGTVLLLVPCDDDGVIQAYRLIKELCAEGMPDTVGVTMVDAPDPQAAEACFYRLAEGIYRFLRLEVVSYGFVPIARPPYAPVNLLAEGDTGVDAAVEGIANLLATDLPGARVAEPAGEAATGTTTKAATPQEPREPQQKKSKTAKSVKTAKAAKVRQAGA